MPLDVEIIRGSEFVRLGPRKELDFEASKEALQRIARACRKRGIDRALLDLRSVPVPIRRLLTREELTALVNTFHDAGFSMNQRLAILYYDDPHRGVRMFAFLGTLHGWNVRAFTDFEKAFMWLAEQTVIPKEPHARVVPIRSEMLRVQVRNRLGLGAHR
jgi:hypothetical protein